jgi:predicted PurR-regulated permease PerM
MSRPKDDLAKTVISILALCGLILTVFWIVRPFMTAAVWAAFIAVSTWPILLRVQKLLWKKRGLAVAAMTLTLLLVFLLPFLGAVGALISHGGAIADFTKALPAYPIPPPPDFLDKIPVAGPKAHETWQKLAADGWPALMEKISPYLVKVAHWFAGRVGSLGVLMAQCLLTLILTAIFYASGEEAVEFLRAFLHKLLGQPGEGLLPLIRGAIRGVAMGVVVTALLQSTFSGIGLAIAGVPFAGPLTAAMVILCIAQVGPGLVLIPATLWGFSSLGTGWGTFLLIWSLVAMVMDNFIKPILIKAGAPLPVLLVFAGVLGGLISLGLIGIFVGPVVLAVAHTLMKAWLQREEEPGAAEEAEAEPARPNVGGSE